MIFAALEKLPREPERSEEVERCPRAVRRGRFVHQGKPPAVGGVVRKDDENPDVSSERRRRIENGPAEGSGPPAGPCQHETVLPTLVATREGKRQ